MGHATKPLPRASSVWYIINCISLSMLTIRVNFLFFLLSFPFFVLFFFFYFNERIILFWQVSILSLWLMWFWRIKFLQIGWKNFIQFSLLNWNACDFHIYIYMFSYASLKIYVRITWILSTCQFNRLGWKKFFQPKLRKNYFLFWISKLSLYLLTDSSNT
jgi:hypothetical protein